ncbi:MAG: penicillin-binding protein 2 [Kiritimatiellae bacterium]|nr:penicillin-binding protein 2 [Kiritimatiellia bacterium]
MDDKYFKYWVVAVTAVFFMLYAAVGYKLCREHLATPDKNSARVSQYDNKRLGLRGKIYDCNGTQHPVAMSLVTREYFVDPHTNSVKLAHRTNLIPVVTHISQALALDPDEVWIKFLDISRDEYKHTLLNNDDQHLWEQKRTRNRNNLLLVSPDEDAYTVLTNETLVSGVGIRSKVVRSYSDGRGMSHVIGFVNSLGEGGSGIELRYDSYLTGVDGRTEGKKDAKQHPIASKVRLEVPPLNGSDVYLTLDHNIQYEVEKALKKAVEAFNAEGGWAIVERVQTGEILAMASFPDFEPEHYNNVNSNIWNNQALTVNYEPGSVMKPIVIAAALNQRVISERTVMDVGNGHWFYCNRILRDHVKGMVDTKKALVKSSNIFCAKVGLMMGNDNLYRYLRAFNFGSKLRIDLGGEQFGILHQPDKWDKLKPTRIPIGQGVAVTALQMVNAFACLANDGVLMQPYVVSKIVSPNGEVVFSNKPQVIGRPVRKEVAHSVREMMVDITRPGGTGMRAAVKGYTVGGKTGTAQKPVKGHYSETDYYASFVGFVPAREPVFAVLVTIDTPKPQHTGGYVAAPVFAEIATITAKYLEVPPDDIDDE